MWFNSKQREEPYQLLTCLVWFPEMDSFSSAGENTGAAWLSSARVVRCWVKSRNERKPSPLVAIIQLGTLGGLPVISREEGGDDVKSSWPLRAGPHTCYNGGDSGMRRGDPEQISKSRLSSDCALQLERMKVESLVIVDQNATVNTFRALYTPPVTPWELVLPEGVLLTARGAGDHGRVSDWGEVVTR